MHNFNIQNNRIIIQPKLTINSPGDKYEQEADALADRVMRMSSNETAKPVTGLIGKSLQRKCAHCEDEEKRRKPVMRKTEAGNEGMQVSSSFASSLNASMGGGSSLPKATRSFMENAFSTDFSSVKIHADAQSAEMSDGINAKAFTYRNDIYFNNGQLDTGSTEGKKLLAHELTHVVQQSSLYSGIVQMEPQKVNEEVKESSYMGYIDDKTWCRDSAETGKLHPGQQCYREIPPEEGFAAAKQECFNSTTHEYVEPSDDTVSAVCGINEDGTCKIQIPPNPLTKCGMRAMGHGISDICGEDTDLCGAIVGGGFGLFNGLGLPKHGLDTPGAANVLLPVLLGSMSAFVYSKLVPAINPYALRLGFKPNYNLSVAPRVGQYHIPYISRVALGMGYEHQGVSLPLVPVKISLTLGMESDLIFAEGDKNGSTFQGNIGLRIDLGRQAGVVLTANRGAGLALGNDIKPIVSTSLGAGIKVADFLNVQLVGNKNDGDTETTYMLKVTGTARKPLPKR